MKKNINQLRILILLVAFGASIFILFNMPINLGLDLQGGTRLVFEGQDTEKVKVNDDSMAGVTAVIRGRIDALGVSEPIIQRKGKSQVIVELPGIKDSDRAIKLIGDTALLEFVEAEWSPAAESALTPEKLKEFYGADAYLGKVPEIRDGVVVSERLIILKKAIMTGADLKIAYPQVDEYGNPSVSFELNDNGAKIFADVTTRHIEKPIAILLDKKIISAPNVKTPITEGKGIITGNFTPEEVKDLVIKLKAGALPVPIKVVETRIVGPTLGKDSIDKSKIAGILGFAFIIAFMILYYRLPGFLSIIALTLYVFMTLAVLGLIRATLTLPGIVGFLLSVGMAVDANVIIFERLKEELRLGKTIKVCIEAAFDRAFTAILDSNVTTVIAAATLFFVGTGTIKGFAITLSIGILVSMFTAITITRMLMDMMVDGKVLTSTETKLLYK
ncbi:MAG: preprotein translocase subunit SecD [Candidatus Saganbacteria bacterium]|uniref:Protein translocase subunit SecD n=1 Tax=Candidatus Saganbacteria bacterium TaxID=2575572 RepID=A0A833L033_UNCSA|nr:MAG: preprotein translocase subunit SecD [Candidatus Saganbacteria bacterium]